MAEMERRWTEELLGGCHEWRRLFVEKLVGGNGKVGVDGRADDFFLFVHPTDTVDTSGVCFCYSGTCFVARLGVGGGRLADETFAEKEIRDEGQRSEGEESEDAGTDESR